MDFNKMEEHRHSPSWDNLPTDVLLLMFERMPTSSLATCLFVSQTWRNHVEHILDVKNKWEELCRSICDVAEFQRKCMRKFDWRQLYYNSILWLSFHKATIKLQQIREFNGIKRIDLYRDDLVVVTNDSARYYDAKTLKIQPNGVDLQSCDDLFENDFMAVEVHKTNGLLTLQFHIKHELSKMYNTKCTSFRVANVLCYKVDNDKCHVLDDRNVHSLYTCAETEKGRSWRKETLGRYYGNPRDSCALNVFQNKCYLMLEGGFILWMDDNSGYYEKMTLVNVVENTTRNDDVKQISENSKEIYREIYTWFYMHDVRVYSLNIKNFQKEGPIDRVKLWSSPNDEAIMYPYITRDASCMLQHGGILFLGYLDGTLELISSQDLLRDLCKTKPLRRFNIKDFKDGITDLAVKAIDVAEDEAVQHMFIATNTHLFHLHIASPNYEYCM